MVSIKYCPSCLSPRITRYEKVGLAPEVDYEVIPKTFIRALIITNYFICHNCGLIFQNPRLSEEELDIFYRDGYYRNIINLTDKEMDYDEKIRAQNDSKIIRKIIGKVGRHLDIGSSRGYLLSYVNAVKKYGIEPNVRYSREKKIKVFPKIEDVRLEKFDLITVIHTLEHVSNPIQLIKKTKHLLKINGHFMVEIPTWKSPGGPLRFAHLYHFEPSVLRGILYSHGFKIIYEEFTPHFLLICQKSI